MNNYKRCKEIRESKNSMEDNYHIRPIEWQGYLLSRGGFKISDNIAGLPHYTQPEKDGGYYSDNTQPGAWLDVTWKNTPNKHYSSTNIARTKMQDDTLIEIRVTKAWLKYMIDNTETLEGGFYYSICVMHSFNAQPNHYLWLEEYSAMQLYYFAMKSWKLTLEEKGITQEEIAAWESGKGKNLPFVYDVCLDEAILNLVLPKVSNLLFEEDGRLVMSPPCHGWKDVLKGWKTFLTSPVKWGHFAIYPANWPDLLWLYQSHDFSCFNIKYRNTILENFGENEIGELINTISEVTESLIGNKFSHIKEKEIAILRKMQHAFGNMQIGTLDRQWKLKNLSLGSRKVARGYPKRVVKLL
jgi:hypothetical protein